MKVFLGILVFTSMALALVDESAALNATPESKKTDLLISTGNGQTIKISTDGKKPIVSQFNRSAQRFRMNKQFIRHVNYRKGQEEDPNNGGEGGSNFGGSDDPNNGGDGSNNFGGSDDPNNGGYASAEDNGNGGQDVGQDSGSNDQGDIVSEIDELNSVIGELSRMRNEKVNYNENDDTYGIPATLVDQILEILEDYEAVLSEGGDAGYQEGNNEGGNEIVSDPNANQDYSDYNDEFRARRRARVQFIANKLRQNKNNNQRFQRNNRLRNGPARFGHP